MANLSPTAYAKRHARTGDRIARRAARLRNNSAKAQGFIPSTGPSLASQIASALKRPGVVATGRPTTAEGVSAFHFSVRPITKGSEATALAGGTARPGASGAHQRYLEREGAAEKTLADIDIDVAHLAAEQQQYIEREAAAEHVLASFGNISNSYEERMEFWRLVEESEYAPKTHVITFNPGNDLAFWKAVDTPALNAPAQLVEAARDKRSELRVDDRAAVAILTFAKAHQSPDNEKTPAVGIEIGRGGRIQTRIIAELPHEISAEKRVQIARDFCEARIANIDPPDTEGPYKGEKKTLRYWAVIHAPDADNDSRNNHLHVVFYERPTDKMLDPTTGKMQWNFAIVTQERDSKRTLRTKRKEERKRSRVTNERKWAGESRAYFAKLVNAALEEAGVKRRIDPRSYKDIGIDEKPIPRMEPKAYQKEKQGTPTNAGDQTIAAQWDRELKRISALYDTVVFDDAVVARFNAAADRFKKTLHASTAEVEKVFDQWAQAVADKRNALAERAAVLFNVAKIRSRLTPPLDHRPKAEIAATKAVIDELQKDELGPLNQLYRAALVKEKTGLATLAKLERAYSAAPPLSVDAPAQPAPSAKISDRAAPAAAALHSPAQPQTKRAAAVSVAPMSAAPPAVTVPAATINAAPPSLTLRPPSVTPTIQRRPPYGSIPGAGSFTPKYKPRPELYAGFDDATAARMEAERRRNWDAMQRDWSQRHKAYVDTTTKAIAAGTANFLALGGLDKIEKALDVKFAELKIMIAEADELKGLDAELTEYENSIRHLLRNGLTVPNTPDIPQAERDLVNDSLAIIAKDKDPVIVAAAKAAIIRGRDPNARTPTSVKTSTGGAPQPGAAAAAPPAAQPQPPIAAPATETAKAPDKAPEAKTADPAAANARPVDTTAADAKAVEPPLSVTPPVAPAAPKVQRQTSYRRRTRELTPEERIMLKAHITSRPKPEDDTPETMPRHAQPRRAALHDEPSLNEATPPISPPIAAPPAAAAQAAPPAPEPGAQPSKAAPIAKAAPPAEAAQPTPAPETAAQQRQDAPTAETEATKASPPVVGPTIDIGALPEAKKRKKKKVSELSPEERRRTFIARRKARTRPQR